MADPAGNKVNTEELHQRFFDKANLPLTLGGISDDTRSIRDVIREKLECRFESIKRVRL